jgi:hypothetical protein
MKIAVINFSGNVGKTTVTHHLLAPRIPGAEVIAVESLNAGHGTAQSLRGRQFGELQEFLQTVDHAVVDIGASNVEDLLALMRRYKGSHADFDCFVVPTVATVKQQKDTMATLVDLNQLGVDASRIKLVFNMVEDTSTIAGSFALLLAFVAEHPILQLDVRCHLSMNEIYQRLKGSGTDLAALASDDTDYKALIAQTADAADKLALAHKLATRRLACGVLPELDACFAALALNHLAPNALGTPAGLAA